MTNVLEEILRTKREEVADLLQRPLRARVTSGPRGPKVVDALLRRGQSEALRLVTEIKRRSPSAGVLSTALSVGERALAYGRDGASMISVLCDRRFFDGGWDHLREAREALDAAGLDVPLLAKEFVIDERQLEEAAACGADSALLIVRIVDHAALARLVQRARALGLEPLVEVVTEDELSAALDADAKVIGVNARDLDTLVMDPARAARVLSAIPDDRIALMNAQTPDMLRFQEYLTLKTTQNTTEEKSELFLRFEPLPEGLRQHVGHITQVARLREVRALYGFSRINPPSGPMGKAKVTPLSKSPKHWLPAVEVRGEGIFITLAEERLREWEAREPVRRRAAALDHQNRQEIRERLGDDAEPRFPITARYVLIHTLSHLLMRELALECGYSTSSLRERLYVDAGELGMCGVLIFTATSDADGTLGGLVQQGRPDRIEALVRSAVDGARWCSSDPLCMTGIVSLSNGLNGAACHSCTLAPETSCETFNHFLDRALIVGIPGDERLQEDQQVGFFADLFPH